MDLTWERLKFAYKRFEKFNSEDEIILMAGGDSKYLPFCDGTLDCVILSGVLEWIPDGNGKWNQDINKLYRFLLMLFSCFGLNSPYSIQLKFLKEVKAFNEMLRSGYIAWTPERKRLYRKVRVYLHKAHKIAPVFDYQRAKKNLELLHVLLGRKFYWPHVPTQLALIIFVTDRNDENLTNNNYILQKNLRALCSCSAYAFHMARNKLNINKSGNLN